MSKSKVTIRVSVTRVALLLIACVGLGSCGDRAAEQREASRENLRRVGTAIHQYHEKYGSFPPAYVLGADGEPWHSWRVLVLPYLGDAEQRLYKQYRFDEPWNGSNNAKLAASIPAVFASPTTDSKLETTPYLAVVGRRTAWAGPFPLGIRDFTDGVSNTILLVDDADSERHWMSPEDMSHREAQEFYIRRSRGEAEFAALFGDGSVQNLRPGRVDRTMFHGLLTPNSGQPTTAGKQLPEELPEVADYDFGDPADAAAAKRTLIIPHLESPLTVNENQIYCATFQMA